MPFPNFHSARITAPGQYDRFATQNIAPGINIILGIKGGKSERQAIRFDKNKFTVQQAKAWLKEHDVKFILFEPATATASMEKDYAKDAEQLEGTYEIPVIAKFTRTFSTIKDILSVGTWQGIPFEKKDLDNMVVNFDILKRGDPDFENGVPLKIDLFKNVRPDGYYHGGEPTFGMITDLVRTGEKLFAKITNIPKLVKDMIENKQYKSVSAEVQFNKEFGNERLSPVLRGLALLGVELPEVNTLEEFQQFYTRNNSGDEDIKSFTVEETKKQSQEDLDMPEIKELEKRIGTLEKGLKDSIELCKTLEKDNKELKNKKKESDDALSKFTTGKRTEGIKSFVKEKVKEGKVLPANEESTVNILSSLSDEKTVKFSKDNKEEMISPRELRMSEIEASPDVVKFDEQLKKSKESKGSKLEEELVNFKKDEDSDEEENDQKTHFIVTNRIAKFKKDNVDKDEPSYTDVLNQVYIDYPNLG